MIENYRSDSGDFMKTALKNDAVGKRYILCYNLKSYRQRRQQAQKRKENLTIQFWARAIDGKDATQDTDDLLNRQILYFEIKLTDMG
jgi:hypothetical protein